MNIRELTIFLTVCETGSMSRAAEALYITQPAVSQAISDLEAALGVRLFERLKKKLVPTYASEVLYEYSRRIVHLLDEAEHAMDEVANMNRGRLRIGASTTIGTYLLPEIVSGFRKQFPAVDMPFVIDNTLVIEKMLLENTIDLALVEGPVHTGEIVTHRYFQDELYLICSAEHPWAARGAVAPEEMGHENLIIREKGSGTREVFENTMNQAHLPFAVKHVLNNTEAIKKSVEANIGIAIISRLAVKEELKAGSLVQVNLEGVRFLRDLNIILHKDKYPSRLLSEFRHFLFSIRDEL